MDQLGNKKEELKKYLKDLESINSSIALIQWDTMVNMPKKAVEYRSDMIAYLSEQSYKLSTSDKVKEFVEYFENIHDLDEITKASIRTLKTEYNRTKKIPAEEYKEYVKETSISTSAWEEAKDKSDFSIFKPHLKKLVEYNRKFAEYWGYKDNKYDAFLDIYEPGITTKKLDLMFGELRDAIIELLGKIKKSGYTPDVEFFKKKFSKESQKQFGEKVLDKMEYDYKNAGRIDEYTHPFTTNFGNKDVRITNHYFENDFRSALFSFIHEGGHAIYEQDIPDSLRGTLLAQGASMGVHESQSRFYENIVGKSRPFWKYFYPIVKETFPQFKDVDFDQFFNGLNYVEPSLIRTEADELTYSLHIIIRYEIEKQLISGAIEVEDLPSIWNKKYKEYIGIEPKDDAEGVLQDMHWSDGSFGYFPSYALGNLYGAQFLNKLKSEVIDIDEKISNGDLSRLHKWLKENIHQYGAIYKPADLIKKVTGEELTAKYFIEYLNKKFTSIYKLN